MLQSSPLLNLPDARPERWTLLCQVIAEWYGPPAPEDGWGDDELRQCAKRLGTPIPNAMREWYGLAGRRDDVWSQQDELLSPERIFCEDRVLHFYAENQCVTYWGVRTEEVSLDDPPVVVRDEHENWVVQSPRFSEFVLHMFAYVVQFGRRLAHIHGFAQPPCVQRIVNGLPALGFPEFIWGGIRLFGFRNLIVSMDCTDHVSASARSEEDLAPFRSLIEGGGFEIIYETD